MTSSDGQGLALPTRFDGDAVPDLLASLLAARGADLMLDGAGVERIGGPALQLLVSAFRTWREDGMRLRLASPSPHLMMALDKLGFAKSPDASEL